MSPAKRFLSVVLTSSIVVMSVSACSHTSQIITDPPKAEVWINNQYFGKSPIIYPTRSGVPTTYYLRTKLEGYEPLDGVPLERAYRADLSLLLLIPAFVPYFFSARLEDQYVFRLRPVEEAKE